MTLLEGHIKLENAGKRVVWPMWKLVLTTSVNHAHLTIRIGTLPSYNAHTKRVLLWDINVTNIRLINDDNALIKDTSFLTDVLLSHGLAGLMTGPLQGAQ